MDRPRLYCFPYAGASSSIFAPWARELDSTFKVLGVDLPGHGSRFKDALCESIHLMAASAAEVISAAENGTGRSSKRFAFYGHSLGAVVAYETARLLDKGCLASLDTLFVGAARAPETLSPVPKISHLDDTGFLEAVQARYGGLPAVLFEEPELLNMVLPVLRSDFLAYENYQSAPGPSLHLSVAGFFGRQDAVVTSTSMEQWSQVSSGPFQLHAMDGGHFFLNDCRDCLLGHVRSIFDTSAASFASSKNTMSA